MKNKLAVINCVQLALWVINTLGLLVIIIIDKDAELLQKLFIWFWILLVVFPVLFSVGKLVLLERMKVQSVDIHEWVPFIGLCVHAACSFVFFIRSLTPSGVILTLILMGAFIGAIVFFIRKLDLKKYRFTTHAIYLGASLALYVLSIVALVAISFYFSTKW